MVYPFAKHIIIPFVKLWVRKIDGLENLPKEKGFIAACNHGSYADDAFLPCAVVPQINKILRIYVNSHYFGKWYFRPLLRWGRCIPVDVDKKKPSDTNKKAFKDAVNYLKNNEPMGIFPEGHRSYADKMRQGKTGVARLALAARVPVVPIGIDDSRDIMPFGSTMPKFKRCSISIGKPVYFDKYYGKENDKKVLRHITDTIMKKIAELANEKYPY